MSESKKPDNPEINKAWDSTKDIYKKIASKPKVGIHIIRGQPGTGKTHSLAEMIAETDKKIAFFSANHDHLEKFKEDLTTHEISESEYIHGKGFTKACLRYPPKYKEKWTDDETFVYNVYNGIKIGAARLLCNGCKRKEKCDYNRYKKYSKNYRITLQPLEFMFTNYNEDKDIFVIDEAVSKKEKVLWNLDVKKLRRFIDILEKISEYKLISDDEIEHILDLHRYLLENVSLVFNEPPSILFSMHEKTFKTDEYKEKKFVQKGYLVAHPEKNHLYAIPNNKILHNFLRLFEEESVQRDFQNENISEIIKRKNQQEINELIKNFVSLTELFKFYKIMCFKKPADESCFVVSERLQKISFDDLKTDDKVIIRSDDKYEWGFIDECPYILNKTNNYCVLSHIGKVFEDVGKKPEKLKDSWITIGNPYMFQVLNIAEKKSVILLDATFNERIYRKLFRQWLQYRASEDIAIRLIKFPTPKVKTHIEETPKISNYNSIVYDVGSSHSLTSLEYNLPEVVGCIANILDNNPDKLHGIISHERFKLELADLFDKAEMAHHFNERGKNINVDLLFVIGTPFRPPISIIHDYIYTFNEYPESTETIEDEGFAGYKDPLLNEIFKVNVYDEIYQELHRSRMLLYNREVYAFCRVPPEINDEVTVEKIEDRDSISGRPLGLLLGIILDNNGIDGSDLYNKTRNRKSFAVVGGAKKILTWLEDEELISIKKEKSKTKSKSRFFITEKGREFYQSCYRTSGVRK